MTTVQLYTQKSSSEVKLPVGFSKEAPLSSIAQAFHVYRERSHTGLPMVQTRGMVSLTTRKMYKQKHTGNARHSSAKAPIFVGGGVTHGPKGIKTTHTLTKSLRKMTKSGSIALKIAQNEFALIDIKGINKTKEASLLIKNTGARNAVVALSVKNWAQAKAFRNIANVSVFPWETMNAYPMLTHHFLLVDSSVLEVEKAEKKPVAKKAVAKKTTK